ncbi:MAG: uracil-DNA glycosylase [Gammaproteobacteria bacterium]
MIRRKSARSFDINCKKCTRLSSFLRNVKKDYPDYHAKPVPSFGPDNAQLIVVGLAPGMHGANRTGRPFTGDHAGVLLYETLFRFGFANQASGDSVDDGLVLHNCRIVNAVKCLPPQNKPTGEEINRCNEFLVNDFAELTQFTVFVALGTIAHGAVLAAMGYRKSHARFAHNAVHHLTNQAVLLDSYHCSRYNTQTKRLTAEMFQAVFATARELIKNNPAN